MSDYLDYLDEIYEEIVDEFGHEAMNKICCFCELELSNESLFCPSCMDYKGVMSITDFNGIYS